MKPRSITVFSHSRPNDTGAALRRIAELAGESGVEVRLPAAEIEKHGLVPGTVEAGNDPPPEPTDLAVVLGGDGTILTHLRDFTARACRCSRSIGRSGFRHVELGAR